MGHTWVEIEISGLEKKQVERVKALVDTGATLTVLPKELADRLGIKPTAESEVQTGAGRIKLKRGAALIKIKDKEGILMVLISDIIDKVLLGVVALESLGFEVDPTTETLKPAPLLLYALGLDK